MEWCALTILVGVLRAGSDTGGGERVVVINHQGQGLSARRGWGAHGQGIGFHRGLENPVCVPGWKL